MSADIGQCPLCTERRGGTKAGECAHERFARRSAVPLDVVVAAMTTATVDITQHQLKLAHLVTQIRGLTDEHAARHHELAMTVPCEKCGAAIGQPCSNLKLRKKGEEVPTKYPHPARTDRVETVADADPTMVALTERITTMQQRANTHATANQRGDQIVQTRKHFGLPTTLRATRRSKSGLIPAHYYLRGNAER